jgi:hypothetical protein
MGWTSFFFPIGVMVGMIVAWGKKDWAQASRLASLVALAQKPARLDGELKAVMYFFNTTDLIKGSCGH